MDILERFLKYVKIETTSSASSDLIPSTKSQYNLARVLIQELKEQDKEGYRNAYIISEIEKYIPSKGNIKVRKKDCEKDEIMIR